MHNRLKGLGFLFAFGLCAIGAIALAAETAKEGAGTTAWKITGQLEEACSCNAACPCWFDSKPTRMTCGGGQVLFIEKGAYGNTSLDNLAVGAMVESPPGQSMMESFGKWKFVYLYVDQKAGPEQRKALEEIGKTVMDLSASPNTKIRYVPITRTIEGKEHKITLGSYGSFHGHLIEGGLGGTPTIKDPPGADPIHHEYQQGMTTKLNYSDAGENWNFANSNYMFGTFTVDNVQYEKFAAGLAQKMKAMNKTNPENKAHK